MADVVSLGELLIDFNYDGANEDNYPIMSGHPGGAVGNFLAALAKCGVSAALIAKVGDDALGHMLKKTIGDVGIDNSAVLIDPDYFTTLAFVTLDSTGDREFSFARKPGADTRLSFEEVPLQLIDEAKVFHIGTLSLTGEPVRTATRKAVAYAKSKGKLISLDPNLRLPLWASPEDAKREMLWALAQADIVKISDNEVEFLFDMTPEDGAKHIMDTFGAKLVFVTLGKDGCLFMNRNGVGRVPGYSVQTIDTCGAGDIFGGSAMYGVLSSGKAPEELTEFELRQITAFACAAAGLSTTKHGGIGSVPETADVWKLMEQ